MVDKLVIPHFVYCKQSLAGDGFLYRSDQSTVFHWKMEKPSVPTASTWPSRKTIGILVKNNLLKLFDGFHGDGKVKGGIMSTSVVLIPNISAATEIKDFRPITLTTSM